LKVPKMHSYIIHKRLNKLKLHCFLDLLLCMEISYGHLQAVLEKFEFFPIKIKIQRATDNFQKPWGLVQGQTTSEQKDVIPTKTKVT
jgi:hypothetical protein